MRGFTRRVRWLCIRTTEGSIDLENHRWLSRDSRSSRVKNHNRSCGWCRGVYFWPLITSTARKVTYVKLLRHSLPLFQRGRRDDKRDELQCGRSKWTSLKRDLVLRLDSLITSSKAFPLVLSFMVAIPTRKRKRVIKI